MRHSKDRPCEACITHTLLDIRRMDDDPVGVYLADLQSFSECVAPALAAACERCHMARPYAFNSIPVEDEPEPGPDVDAMTWENYGFIFASDLLEQLERAHSPVTGRARCPDHATYAAGWDGGCS